MQAKPVLLLSLLLLGGCAGVDVSHYRGQAPQLVMEEYFNGTLDAWGMFQKRGGEVVKRFKVVIEAKWRGEEGILDERFSYSDGTTQRRIWHLTRTGNGEYIGKADDVVGEARGRVSGNALHWVYTLRLPVDDEVYEVVFDDWMYLQDDRVMINRSSMRKFGVELGEVTLFFRKRS